MEQIIETTSKAIYDQTIKLRAEVKMTDTIDRLSKTNGVSKSFITRFLINEGMKHIGDIKLISK